MVAIITILDFGSKFHLGPTTSHNKYISESIFFLYKYLEWNMEDFLDL